MRKYLPIILTISHLMAIAIGLNLHHLHGVSSAPFTQGSGSSSSSNISSPDPVYTMEDLLDAVEQVESGCDANAIGDNGNAVGSFQIWKIYVDDVNRIGKRHYSYIDRLDRARSREMVSCYLRHYGGTVEQMARKHNGGPTGDTKVSTLKYWAKVKKQLEAN